MRRTAYIYSDMCIGVKLDDDHGIAHRHIYIPGDDISSEPQYIQDVAGILWTDAIIQAYSDSINGNV